MTKFWAVFIDETGCEFGAAIEADTKAEAIAYARENWPESRLDQIESPQDTREREAHMMRRLEAEMNGEFYPEDE